MSTPIGVSQLLAVFFSCIFFGLNLVTTGMCFDVLLRDRRRNGKLSVLQRVYMGCVLFMLGNSIFDAVLQLDLAMRIFVTYTGPGGPTAALLGPAYKLGQLQDVPYGLQTVVGDALLTHRAYAVYSYNWKILVAFVPAYLVVAILGLYSIFLSASHHVAITATGAMTLSPFLTPALACSFAINVAATSLIAIKLAKVLKSRSEFATPNSSTTGESPRSDSKPIPPRDERFRQLLRIAIESGALYAVTVLAFIVTFLVRDPVSHVLSGVVVMNIAIAFNLIIIRVYRTRDADADTNSNETPDLPSIAFHERSTIARATVALGSVLSSRTGTDASPSADLESEGTFNAMAEKV